eukprot:7388540-Prymnesium_polylepis.1
MAPCTTRKSDAPDLGTRAGASSWSGGALACRGGGPWRTAVGAAAMAARGCRTDRVVSPPSPASFQPGEEARGGTLWPQRSARTAPSQPASLSQTTFANAASGAG